MHAGQPYPGHECCPVCVRILELFTRFPTAVRYANKCCVTSHDTSTGLLGTFQASNIGEWYTKTLFTSRSIILATLNFWWEFPFKKIHGIVCLWVSLHESGTKGGSRLSAVFTKGGLESSLKISFDKPFHLEPQLRFNTSCRVHVCLLSCECQVETQMEAHVNPS